MLTLADYKFYTETYGGTLVDENAWPAAIREASAFVNNLTYGRLSRQPAEDIPEEAKLAACAAAEAAARCLAAAAERTVGVASESVGGHSVSYTGEDLLTEKRRGMLQTASLYLPLSHPLRYAGVERC